MSQIILTLQSRVIKLLESPNNQWFWLIQRLLNLNLGQILALVKSRGQDSIAVSLRMLEVFTSLKILGNILSHEKAKTVQGRIYTYLVGKNYFKSLKYLLDEKTPPLLCESVDPPTPLVACLFDLLIRPLHLVDVVTPHDFRYKIFYCNIGIVFYLISIECIFIENKSKIFDILLSVCF